MKRSLRLAMPGTAAKWLALSSFALLAACGGGGDDTPPATVLTANPDTLSLDIGQSGSLLSNDRIGSAAANGATGGNSLFSVTSGSLPAGVTIDAAGTVSVGATAIPGVTNIGYRLCEAASSSNCASTTAQITVPAPAIVATADSFTLAVGASGDVLANDTLRALAATAAQVTVNATTALPSGVTLSAAGLLSVGSGATAGASSIGYRVCQTVAPTNCATATVSLTVPALGTLSGRAIDAATGLGIAGVTVTAAGQTATTDATGAYTLPSLAVAARLPVHFTADTHAETVGLTAIAASATSELQVRMLKVSTSTDVAINGGGTVTVAGSTAQVVLPADGVQRADGSIPTGQMRVRVTPIDPAADSSVMPGDYTTLVSGTPTQIESFGALNVTLSDSTGQPLNLRAGQTATLRIPLGSRSATPPATIPLFYFDPASGRWVQEGTATLAGTGTGRYYQGTVAHFSTWNADQVMNSVQVTGCVADANGTRVVNARVFSDGIDYSGTSGTMTDNAGNFTIAIRSNSRATLVATSGALRSNTFSAGPYAVNTTLASCLQLGQSGSGVTMTLTWGLNPGDLDSHLYTPSGTEIYYRQRGSLTVAPFVNLDVDDTDSYGPEVVTITKLMVGTYKYFVHNYDGYADGPIAASSARVELNIPGRAAELFTPPATGESSSTDYWTLFEMDVDAQCNITVRRVPGYASSPPTLPASSTPVYCTRP